MIAYLLHQLTKGKGYSHRRGANRDNFFVIRTAAVLHGGANKQNFLVIHTAAVRIRDLSQLFAPHHDESKVYKLLFCNSSILFDINQKAFLLCISLLIIFFINKNMHFLFLFYIHFIIISLMFYKLIWNKWIHAFVFFSLFMYYLFMLSLFRVAPFGETIVFQGNPENNY